jgi:predicted RNA-binding Zn ribbon-like protein
MVDTYYTGVVTPMTEFRFGLGHPVLEFVATRAGRLDEPYERLATPAALSRWLEQAGFASGADCDEALLDDACALREAIYRVLDAARAGRRPTGADLGLINAWARRPAPSPKLDADLRRTWVGPDPAPAAVAELAGASIDLLSGPDLARVRHCANPECSLLFIDRSRPGRRRWCSMERCGNRAKTARYRRRRAG